MPEPKIIEGRARRKPPLSKPLALIYIAAGIGALGWAYFTRSNSDAYFFFIAGVAACTGGLITSLLNEID